MRMIEVVSTAETVDHIVRGVVFILVHLRASHHRLDQRTVLFGRIRKALYATLRTPPTDAFLLRRPFSCLCNFVPYT